MYARVAKGRNGIKAEAGRTPQHKPLTEIRDGYDRELPTVHFALDVEVSDHLLDPALWPSAAVELADRGMTLIEARQPEDE